MDTWTIVLSVSSFILALISVVIVIITIRQNNRMLEQATRPVVSCYTTQVNIGTPTVYLVFKNIGSSPATITKYHCEQDIADCLLGYGEIPHDDLIRFDPKERLPRTILAPGQSKICGLDYRRLPTELKIKIEYTSSAKHKYNDSFTFDPKAGLGMPTRRTKAVNPDEVRMLGDISDVLYEMLQKDL